MSTARRLHRPSSVARAMLFACAATVASGAARAAAEDVNATPQPGPVEAAAPAQAPGDTSTAARVLAFGKRMLDSVVDRVVASERSVVDAFSGNAAAAAPAGDRLRIATGASALDARSVAAVARAGADAAASPAGADDGGDPSRRLATLDLSLGARWRVLQGDADTHVPCVSWMADVQPVSADAFLRGDAMRPSMHLSAEWLLPGEFSLGLMPGVALDTDRQGRRSASGTLAVTLGKELAPGVRTFVDFARDHLAIEQGGGSATTLDAGITLATGASTQVDFALTRGLTPAAPAFQAGVGVSSSF